MVKVLDVGWKFQLTIAVKASFFWALVQSCANLFKVGGLSEIYDKLKGSSSNPGLENQN